MSALVVDLFAGPGGWDVAATALGLRPVGVEWDPAACRTAEAAGHIRLQTDVAALDPRTFGPVRLLIASPPCQPFSPAGRGLGRAAIEPLTLAIKRIAAGDPIEDVRAQVNTACDDPRAALVVEPMYWIVHARPAAVALEQVPPVLPLWHVMAEVMAGLGYSVAAGNLSAEQYDVPQTRRRAVLVASREHLVRLPPPVRQAYRKGVPPTREGELFSLPPWVSMAQALGWGMTAQPSMTVTGGGASTGGAEPFGNGARRGLARERDAGRWALRTGNFTAMRRDADGRRTREGSEPYERSAQAPAPTVRAAAPGSWVHERPATTVQGDARLGRPGRKHRGPDCCLGNLDAGAAEPMFAADSVRVSVAEAAALQGFPPDYPWHGTKTAQYRQVGDAVPPPLAWHVLRAALGEQPEHYPGTPVHPIE